MNHDSQTSPKRKKLSKEWAPCGGRKAAPSPGITKTSSEWVADEMGELKLQNSWKGTWAPTSVSQTGHQQHKELKESRDELASLKSSSISLMLTFRILLFQIINL